MSLSRLTRCSCVSTARSRPQLYLVSPSHPSHHPSSLLTKAPTSSERGGRAHPLSWTAETLSVRHGPFIILSPESLPKEISGFSQLQVYSILPRSLPRPTVSKSGGVACSIHAGPAGGNRDTFRLTRSQTAVDDGPGAVLSALQSDSKRSSQEQHRHGSGVLCRLLSPRVTEPLLLHTPSTSTQRPPVAPPRQVLVMPSRPQRIRDMEPYTRCAAHYIGEANSLTAT